MPNDMTGEFTVEKPVMETALIPTPPIDYSMIERRMAEHHRQMHEAALAQYRAEFDRMLRPQPLASEAAIEQMNEYLRRRALIDDCTPSRVAVIHHGDFPVQRPRNPTYYGY